MYIEQGKKGRLGMWKYIPLPLGFFLLMGANYLFTVLSNIDTNKAMEDQIALFGKTGLFVMLMIPFIIFLGGLLFWVWIVHRQPLLSLTTSRKKVDWSRVFFSFGLVTIFIVSSTVLGYYASPEDFKLNFDLGPFVMLLVLALVLVPIQTSFEEYMFRGYMMQGIGLATKNRWFPLLFTSVTFGLMHLANPEVGTLGPVIMVYYIGTGLFLGIITLMDEGLELALGFHAANNLITVLLVTADWTALQTDSILIDVSDPGSGYEVFFPVLIIFPIFLFIFSKKYQWIGWKDKLFGRVHS